MGISVWPEPRRRKDGGLTWIPRAEQDGVRLSSRGKSFRTKGECDRECVHWRDELEGRRSGRPQKVEPITVSKLADLYLHDRAGADEPQTIERIRFSLIAFSRHFGDPAVAAVTPEGLREWKTAMLAKRKPGGVRKEMQNVRSVFGWGRRQRPPYVIEDPFDLVELPRAPKSSGQYLTDTEFDGLLEGIAASVLVPTLVILWTGMRRSEVCPPLFDWRFIRQTTIKPPKGRAIRVWAVKLPKTKMHPEGRTVVLHSEVMKLIGPPKDSGPVFPGLKPRRLTQAMRRAAIKAGRKGIRQHDARHKFLTDIAPLTDWTTQKAAGGHKTDAAASVYQHIDPRRMAFIEQLRFRIPKAQARAKASKEGGRGRSSPLPPH